MLNGISHERNALIAMFGRVRVIFKRLSLNLQRRRKYREVYSNTLSELRALDDRDLKDLGMHRANLPAIAMEAAARKVGYDPIEPRV